MIILDLMLPGGSGLEVLKLVRQKASETRVFVMTASSDVQALQDAASLAPQRVLRKPIYLLLRGLAS